MVEIIDIITEDMEVLDTFSDRAETAFNYGKKKAAVYGVTCIGVTPATSTSQEREYDINWNWHYVDVTTQGFNPVLKIK